MKRQEVAKALVNYIPALCCDVNGSIVHVKKVPSLASIKDYVIKAVESVAARDTKNIRVYFAEYGKDIFSDDRIGKLKPAIARVFLHGVKRNDFEDANTYLVKQHEIPFVRKLLATYKKCGESKKTVLVSRGVFKYPFVRHFKFDYSISNDTCFESIENDEIFAGFYLPIRTAQDKLEATERLLNKELNLSVSQCGVMVDGINDIPLIEESALSIASPFAHPKVSKQVDYSIRNYNDYRLLIRDIEEEVPKTEPRIF